jgi:hypothetical protein
MTKKASIILLVLSTIILIIGIMIAIPLYQYIDTYEHGILS